MPAWSRHDRFDAPRRARHHPPLCRPARPPDYPPLRRSLPHPPARPPVHLTYFVLLTRRAVPRSHASPPPSSLTPARTLTHTPPGGLISLHRPDFQAALLRHLGPRVRTHTGKRLVAFAQPPPSPPSASSSSNYAGFSASSSAPGPSSSYAAPDGATDGGGAVRLTFADGTRAACDVLVGADGVRSAVRAGMLAGDERHKADAVWSGTASYRATVSADALRRRWPGHRVLSGPYIVSRPILCGGGGCVDGADGFFLLCFGFWAGACVSVSRVVFGQGRREWSRLRFFFVCAPC